MMTSEKSPMVQNGRVIRGELIATTRMVNGYSGDTVDCKIYFSDDVMMCETRFGVIKIGCEADSASAKWRLLNTHEYRNFACNKFYTN